MNVVVVRAVDVIDVKHLELAGFVGVPLEERDRLRRQLRQDVSRNGDAQDFGGVERSERDEFIESLLRRAQQVPEGRAPLPGCRSVVVVGEIDQLGRRVAGGMARCRVV